MEPDGWDMRGRSLSWTRLLVAEGWPKPIPVRLQRPRDARGEAPGRDALGFPSHGVAAAASRVLSLVTWPWVGTGHPPRKKPPGASRTCRSKGQAATDVL